MFKKAVILIIAIISCTTMAQAAATWNSTTEYPEGSIVEYNGYQYESRWSNSNNIPGDENQWGAWELVSSISQSQGILSKASFSDTVTLNISLAAGEVGVYFFDVDAMPNLNQTFDITVNSGTIEESILNTTIPAITDIYGNILTNSKGIPESNVSVTTITCPFNPGSNMPLDQKTDTEVLYPNYERLHFFDNNQSDNNSGIGNQIVFNGTDAQFYNSVIVQLSLLNQTSGGGTKVGKIAISGFRTYPTSTSAGGIVSQFEMKDVNQHGFFVVAIADTKPFNESLVITAKAITGSPDNNIGEVIYTDNTKAHVNINQGITSLIFSNENGPDWGGNSFSTHLNNGQIWGTFIKYNDPAPGSAYWAYTQYPKQPFPTISFPVEIHDSAEYFTIYQRILTYIFASVPQPNYEGPSTQPPYINN